MSCHSMCKKKKEIWCAVWSGSDITPYQALTDTSLSIQWSKHKYGFLDAFFFFLCVSPLLAQLQQLIKFSLNDDMRCAGEGCE